MDGRVFGGSLAADTRDGVVFFLGWWAGKIEALDAARMYSSSRTACNGMATVQV